MSENTDISATLAAKSDQLNAADLAEPTVVTVSGVKVRAGDEQPVVVEIDGDRQPYKPCKGMRRLLAQLWGTDASRWVGRTMRLYCDQSVTYGGQTVGGIRIDGLSAIPAGAEVKVPINRGKYKVYRIEKLASVGAATAPDADPREADEKRIHAEMAPLRQQLAAEFRRLGWDRETQTEWIAGTFPDPAAAMRDGKSILSAIAMLEKTPAVPARDTDNDIPF